MDSENQESSARLADDEDSASSRSLIIASTNLEFNCGVVSTLNECTTRDASELCIFDLAKKLKYTDQYDIGGTYYEDGHGLQKSQLWFYFSTSPCSDSSYLLNIFVYHQNIGSFEIGISEDNHITEQKKSQTQTFLTMPTTLSLKTFKSIQIGQSHHIITYCFTKADLLFLSNNNLYIPITINMTPKQQVEREVLWRIKRKHDLIDVFKKQEDTDFTLKSTDGKIYETNKTILAAHSQVLRDEIRKNKTNSLTINVTDAEMQLLLEYMYEGTIKDIHKKDFCKLIELAGKYKLDNLFEETKTALYENINIGNAVDIALLCEKYKLDNLQKAVYDFMKNNPKFLETESWANMNNITVAKKLLTKVFSEIT